MVAVTVVGFLMAGIMAFYVQNLRSMYASDQRMKLAGQIKKFSNELIVQASRSNLFVLYKSATAADFDGSISGPDANDSDRQIINVIDPANPLHPAGVFAVFVYYEIPKPANQPLHRITKIEGYFIDPAAAGTIGEVKKIVIDLSSSPSTSTVEAILTANWSTATFTSYFSLARGLMSPEVIDGTAVPTSATPTPRLFYMSNARNVLISGQLYSSQTNRATNDQKTYTDSFFFNITPRT